jgi:A1 cistron-splicing factor AAR2
VLYFQLKELPEDFFVDITTQDNFLTVNLHNLFDNINDTSQLEDISFKNLRDKSNKFKNFLEQRFQINFETCPDEYAPVLVENE